MNSLLSIRWNSIRQGDPLCRNARTLHCIGMLPFIEDLSETIQSGLVASSHDSEEHP